MTLGPESGRIDTASLLMDEREVHFSDPDVTLYNTLDYPSYGVAIEKVKTSFRLAYSLFNKIAYYLNDCFRPQATAGLKIIKSGKLTEAI